MSLLLVTPDGSDTERVDVGQVCLHSGHTPQWSPDGSRLAVRLVQPCQAGVTDFEADATGIVDVSDGGVTVIPDAVALPGRLWSLGGWSPDGRHLLVHGSRSGVLGIVDQSFIPLAAPRGATLEGGAWSPDGSRIALFDASDEGICESPLYVADPETGTVEPVVSTAGLGASWPAWSPDGRLLAFSTNGCGSDEQLALYDLARGTGTLLSQPDGWAAGSPVWSPKGNRIAFVATCNACDVPMSELRVIDDADACWASPTDCAPRTIVSGAVGYADATWSPAGDRLAYQVWADYDAATWAIWTITADGSGALQVGPITPAQAGPAWQPGG